MKEAFIKAVDYYLPANVLTNEELVEEFPEWTVDKIATKIGVSKRHIASENETAGDMACKAAEMLFNQGINRNEVDFVILCTQSPDYFLPSTACLIQSKLGLSTRCGAFDIDLGCSGFEYGLAVAKGLIVANIANNVLLLTAETYTKYLHPSDKGNRTIFGDGATATLISNSGFAKIGEFVLGTDGNGADKLIVRTGASRSKEVLNDLRIDETGCPLSSDYLFMDGKAIFDFTVEHVPPMIKETLEKNDTTMSDISLFIFHQANKFMINFLRKVMKIDKDKFYEYMNDVGNTVSSTIPICICESLKEGRLRGKVLLAGFGVGLSWGACVIEMADDKH